MNDEELLQHAKENYFPGDKITRIGFEANRDDVTIRNCGELIVELYNKSIFMNNIEIYCGENKIWATNISKGKITTPSYEIY